MSKLQQFYNARVAEAGDQSLAFHVGHTLGGAALPAKTFDALAAELWELLELGPEDHLLDLCCGNGIFSRLAAPRVASVTGVDFTPELIRVAKTTPSGVPDPDTLRFFQGDARHLDQVPALSERRYSKVLMNASLQHFPPRSAAALLDQVLALTTETPVILFAHVPERGKERAFFNTPRKRLWRAWLRLTGQDIFGHWWQQRDLDGVARARGLTTETISLGPEIPYAHYRMHLRLRRPAQATPSPS